MEKLYQQIQNHVDKICKVKREDYLILMRQFQSKKQFNDPDQSIYIDEESFLYDTNNFSTKHLQEKQSKIDQLILLNQEYEATIKKLRQRVVEQGKDISNKTIEIEKYKQDLDQQQQINIETLKNLQKLDMLYQKSQKQNLSLKKIIGEIQKFKNFKDNMAKFNELVQKSVYKQDKMKTDAFNILTINTSKNLYFKKNQNSQNYVHNEGDKLKFYYDVHFSDDFKLMQDINIEISKIIDIKDNNLFLLDKDNQKIILYDLKNQKIIQELDLGVNIDQISRLNVNEIAYIYDQNKLNFVSFQKKKLIKKNQEIEIPDEYDILSGICYYKKQLYLGLSDFSILEININENEKFRNLTLPNNSLINDIKITFNKFLIIITEDTILIYNILEDTLVTQIMIDKESTCIELGDLNLFFGNYNGEIQIYNINTGTIEYQFKVSEFSIQNIQYEPQDQSLYITDENENLFKFIDQ